MLLPNAVSHALSTTRFALSRKFVILDIVVTSPATIAALAGATLVLGVVYWLLLDADERAAQTEAMQDRNTLIADSSRTSVHIRE